MEIALRFLRYSEKIARAYSAIAQNSTLWKSTFTVKVDFHRVEFCAIAANKLARFFRYSVKIAKQFPLCFLAVEIVANIVNIRKLKMALALNRRFLLVLQKQLLLSICYLILRRIKQKRAKRKRTKSMWVRPLLLERRSKGLFNILIYGFFYHFYFLFRALFVLVSERSCVLESRLHRAF